METLWLKKRDSEDSPKSDLDLRFVNIDLVSLTFGSVLVDKNKMKGGPPE